MLELMDQVHQLALLACGGDETRRSSPSGLLEAGCHLVLSFGDGKEAGGVHAKSPETIGGPLGRGGVGQEGTLGGTCVGLKSTPGCFTGTSPPALA